MHAEQISKHTCSFNVTSSEQMSYHAKNLIYLRNVVKTDFKQDC